MTPTEKIKQMCDSWNIEDKPYVNGIHRTDIEEMLEQMHDWTKEQVAEKTIKLMQHWILEHDYVDIMELEDYVKQKMDERL